MEVTDGVHVVPVRWSRAYLLEYENLALVDTGPPWGVGAVMRYIRSIGRSPDEVEFILITHSHPDDSLAAATTAQRTGARILAHAGDTLVVSSGERYLSYIGALSRLRSAAGLSSGASISSTVQDQDIVPIRGGVKVLHAPGHTPGSVCYLLHDEGVLFSGDTIFSDGVTVSRSAPFPKSNTEDYRASLARLADEDFDVLCGGHGRPLVGNASERVRDLLATSPNPPTWRSVVARSTTRLLRSLGFVRGTVDL